MVRKWLGKMKIIYIYYRWCWNIVDKWTNIVRTIDKILKIDNNITFKYCKYLSIFWNITND